METKLKPEPGVKYFYRHDKAWTVDHKILEVQPGIVVDVELDDNGMYNFRFDGEDIRYRCYCYYGWAFIKYTDDNMIKYNTVKELHKNIVRLTQDIHDIESTIEQLNVVKQSDNSDEL